MSTGTVIKYAAGGLLFLGIIPGLIMGMGVVNEREERRKN